MSKKVLISADSTCDLSPELIKRYNIAIKPLHVTFGEKSFDDSVDIFPDEIYKRYEETGELPKTAAVNVGEYIDFFQPYLNEGYEIVHINIGRALSSSHANCKLAAEQLEGVYPVDSCNLSTGSGLLVLEAADRRDAGMSAEDIAKEVQALTGLSHASFVLDTLKFLAAGGRCSALAALGANLLQIRPSIAVDNTDGSMSVEKKFRGKLSAVVPEYISYTVGKYQNISRKRGFITHSGLPKEMERSIYDAVKKLNLFDELFVTRAGCTISSHCGPNTIGVLFMTEE